VRQQVWTIPENFLNRVLPLHSEFATILVKELRFRDPQENGRDENERRKGTTNPSEDLGGGERGRMRWWMIWARCGGDRKDGLRPMRYSLNRS